MLKLKDIQDYLKQQAEKKDSTTSYRYRIDAEKCRNCDKCRRACQVGAISGDRGQVYVINPRDCTGCGTCLKWCKHRAIMLEKSTDLYGADAQG
jgi:MinD superfamily P-loop ATPase